MISCTKFEGFFWVETKSCWLWDFHFYCSGLEGVYQRILERLEEEEQQFFFVESSRIFKADVCTWKNSILDLDITGQMTKLLRPPHPHWRTSPERASPTSPICSARPSNSSPWISRCGEVGLLNMSNRQVSSITSFFFDVLWLYYHLLFIIFEKHCQRVKICKNQS